MPRPPTRTIALLCAALAAASCAPVDWRAGAERWLSSACRASDSCGRICPAGQSADRFGGCSDAATGAPRR